jgi:adenylate cyclase, class 2
MSTPKPIAQIPREVEIKLHVKSSPQILQIRRRLFEAGAIAVRSVLETNMFYDTPDRRLQKADAALRIRSVTRDGSAAPGVLITWKGPAVASSMHNRPSIDLTVAPAEQAEQFLMVLGFQVTLGFEKKRESWKLGKCSVELDELPVFGSFVEIEGPDEPAVTLTQKQLSLKNLKNEPQSYLGMISDYLAKHPEHGPVLRFIG